LLYIHYYNLLWEKFASLDDDGDRRLTKEEFHEASQVAGLDDPDAAFEAMDGNSGGYVLFDEFCAWMAKRDAEQ
jgi:Ca2+-binding EF-hand superfamily protein